MSLLLHISDTHFGTERPHVVAALQELVRQRGPSLVVLSGDITQRARRYQFDAACAFLQGLSLPLLAIPGNHDIPLFNLVARGFAPYANYTRVFGRDLEPEHESPSLLILCLNTTRPSRHTDGEISGAQIERVATRLRAASPEQLRVVVTHQPVHVIRPSDVQNLVHGHQAAVRAWSAAGADLVLGGHIHLPYVRPLSDAFPDLPRELWAVQAGTAVSERVRGGISNSINLIHHHTDAPELCTVERWDYDDGKAAFAHFESQNLRLDRKVVNRELCL
ncbi:MAG TPA: metallophosphoesterase [Polyangiaceae bacterium]|nr:metallophosphoesterase [Polyangiaceae bacterium]